MNLMIERLKTLGWSVDLHNQSNHRRQRYVITLTKGESKIICAQWTAKQAIEQAFKLAIDP